MEGIHSRSAIRWVISALMILGVVNGVGITVKPVSDGNAAKLSNPKNLANCLSYPTVKDDLIMVDVNVAEKHVSQSLNVHIFDSENNQIRHQKNVQGEMSVIFSNLNNPTSNSHQVLDIFRRTNIFNARSKEAVANDLVNSDKGKSLIYVCFDNVYSDRSWTFHPLPFDVELFVDIKDKESIKVTNYQNYAQYFSKVKHEENKKVGKDTKSTGVAESEKLTEESFDTHIGFLKGELKEILTTIDNSETLVKELLSNEGKLRDVNEEIYSNFTIGSVVSISCITVFGLGLLIYFKYYLKKRKII